ncbi:phenylalanine--tRNA ligase subunit beta [Coemansia brasiliensis]|uniref:phenylalanine--tRNA ligase n=1 Tax=Coemansia brasiliensis TaxID=2650707 RepID=A0A9W8I9A6_9FUNG|nr:phenylalanine--tRNA ligase subunit beta [Coemansia brasiliensis]
MPTIHVDKEDLFEYLGNQFNTEEFRELCFEFGIELEEDTSEKGELAEGERAQLKIDIPANRYDLLCFEGLTRALGVFLGRESITNYHVAPTSNPHRITVAKECSQVRPLIVGAILRNIKLDAARYKSFIDLQDKLNQNLGHKRELVSIGTHDLDTVQGPFTYEAVKPEDLKFVPLEQTEEMDGHRIMEFYEKDKKIKKFLHIIEKSPVYPVVYDANRTVMSLPPLINSNHSKITLDTKNIFIEITAMDMTKVNMALNILVTMFSVHCKEPFTVEPVEVVYPDGKSFVYPDFETKSITTTAKYLNGIVGIEKSNSEIVELLQKMSLEAKVEQDSIVVKLPLTRPDMLQECDIAEDLAIAFGYNRIPRVQNNEATVGAPLPINKLTDIVRREMAMAGWTEVLTLSLCAHDENFKFLRREDKGDEVVVLANPETLENQICRSLLLPGLLKTVRENKRYPIPIKVFEVSDVVYKDPTTERGARNRRHACALYASDEARFEIIQGLLDTVMESLGVAPYCNKQQGHAYYLVEADLPMYLPGRSAKVMLSDNGNTVELGTIGIIHPEVLFNFELKVPISSFEINIEPFL